MRITSSSLNKLLDGFTVTSAGAKKWQLWEGDEKVELYKGNLKDVYDEILEYCQVDIKEADPKKNSIVAAIQKHDMKDYAIDRFSVCAVWFTATALMTNSENIDAAWDNGITMAHELEAGDNDILRDIENIEVVELYIRKQTQSTRAFNNLWKHLLKEVQKHGHDHLREGGDEDVYDSIKDRYRSWKYMK